MYKRPLIIFEGIEGSGKSTQINRVAKYLDKKNIKYIKIREPGGSSNSERIRSLLLNKKSNFNTLTDLFLYMASRNENIVKILSKNYNKKVILIDRFIYSSIAYQHYGMKIDIKFINLLNKMILKNIKPTYIFLHTVSINNMIKRLKKRKQNNRYDNFNKSFYRRVQGGFIKALKRKKNVSIINSNNNIENNTFKIINKIKDLI